MQVDNLHHRLEVGIVRAALIELRNSNDAMRRLLPTYEASARTGDMSDAAIGEISTVVRALRSSLDKIANQVYVDMHGASGNRTYFPLTDDPTKFDALLEKNLPKIERIMPKVAEAIRNCQPFTADFACLGLLPNLYRVNTHHGFELHDRRPSIVLQDAPEEDAVREDRWADDEETWPGLIQERRVWEVMGGNFFDVDVEYRHDWYFDGRPNSVFGALLGIHNATTKVVAAVSAARQNPVEPVEIASLALRVKFH